MAEYINLTIGDWCTGTDDLSLEQEAAYLRVVLAINLYDQPIRNNLRVLSGMWRCNERKAKRLLQELIDAGKLWVEDALIFNERAVNDVSKRRALRLERRSSGHRGGIESGKSRRNPLENNNQDEAGASTEGKVRKGKVIGGGGSAHTREADPDDIPFSEDEPEPAVIAATSLRDQVLEAARIDIAKERNPARWLGSETVHTINQWLAMPLTPADVVETVSEVMASKGGDPPKTLAYFTEAMRRRAGRNQQRPLTPIDGGLNDRPASRQARAEADLAADLAHARDLDRQRRGGG